MEVNSSLCFPSWSWPGTLDVAPADATFLCASEPPYWRAIWSPISTYLWRTNYDGEREDRWKHWKCLPEQVKTYISMSILTIMEEGSSLGEDLIPITTSCCPNASTPALNWATFVLSKQLQLVFIKGTIVCKCWQSQRKMQNIFHLFTHSIQFVLNIPICSIGKNKTPPNLWLNFSASL